MADSSHSSSSRYACSLRGSCEVDPLGLHPTLSNCQSSCQPLTRLEEVFLIFSYNPRDAAGLAPSDRVEIISRLAGVRVAPEDSRAILLALDSQNILPLLPYEELITYAQS